MGILKFAIIGAAVAYGITAVTKKRETDGKSILDDLQEQAPEWMDKIKKYADDTLQQVNQKVDTVKDEYASE